MILQRNTFRQEFTRKPEERQEFRGNIAETERKYVEERNTDYRQRVKNSKPFDIFFAAGAGVLAGIIGWRTLKQYGQSIGSPLTPENVPWLFNNIASGKKRLETFKKYRYGSNMAEIFAIRKSLGLQQNTQFSTKMAMTLPSALQKQNYDTLPFVVTLLGDAVSDISKQNGMSSDKANKLKKDIAEVITDYMSKSKASGAKSIDRTDLTYRVTRIIYKNMPKFEDKTNVERVFQKLNKLIEQSDYANLQYNIGVGATRKDEILTEIKDSIRQAWEEVAFKNDTDDIASSVVKGHVAQAGDASIYGRVVSGNIESNTVYGKVISRAGDIYESVFDSLLNKSYKSRKQLKAHPLGSIRNIYVGDLNHSMTGESFKLFDELQNPIIRKGIVADIFTEMYGDPKSMNRLARQQLRDDVISLINDSKSISTAKKGEYIRKIETIHSDFRSWKSIANLYDDITFDEEVRKNIIEKNFRGRTPKTQSRLDETVEYLFKNKDLNRRHLHYKVEDVVLNNKHQTSEGISKYILAHDKTRAFKLYNGAKILNHADITGVTDKQFDKVIDSVLSNKSITKEEIQKQLDIVLNDTELAGIYRGKKWDTFQDKAKNMVKNHFANDIATIRDEIYKNADTSPDANTTKLDSLFLQKVREARRKYVTTIRITRTSEQIDNATRKQFNRVAQYAEILNANGESIRRFQADFDIGASYFDDIFGDMNKGIMDFHGNP